MKFRHSFLSGFIFSAIIGSSSGFCQQPALLLDFADQLYASANYQESITEYQRFTFFHPDHPLAFYAFYQSGMAYKNQADWQGAIAMLKRSLNLKPAQKLSPLIRYQLAFCYLANGDYDLGQLELFKLLKSPDSSRTIKPAAAILYGMTLVRKQDWGNSRTVFQQLSKDLAADSSGHHFFNDIDQTFEQLIQMRRKSPSTARWLSTFLPGAGQIYAGKYGNGLNALLLNAATSYFVFSAAQKGEVRDVALILTSIWLRYYIGNRMHAEEMAIRSNQEKQRKILVKFYGLVSELSAKLPQQNLIISKAQLEHQEKVNYCNF